MIRLILMRHAKSSWKVASQTDHQRPLNKRGRSDAPKMARRLAELGWTPSLALVSDAARTEETWAWMAEEFEVKPLVLLKNSLYHGTIEQIREAVGSHAQGHATILVLGHNPGWEDALEALSGRVERLTTGNAALLMHAGSWEEALEKSDWTLHAIVRPKKLPKA